MWAPLGADLNELSGGGTYGTEANFASGNLEGLTTTVRIVCYNTFEPSCDPL